MDWNRFNQELRNVIDTGSIVYGTKNVKRNCYIGEPKILVLSNTIAKHIKEEFVYFAKLLNIKIIEYPESSTEFGSVCGKPFSISVISITDFGKSSITEALESKNTTSENTKVINKRIKKEVKEKKKKEINAKIAAKKAEKVILDDKQASEKKEKEEVPITEDKMFKDIIKIKKK